jgi:hypothetical protein
MNKESKTKLLGISIVVVGVAGGEVSARIDQPKQQEATPNVQVSRKTAVPQVTEDSIKTVVRNGEWVCQEKKKTGAWEKAFQLKLSPDKLKAVTPTGPILPIEGNPAIFNAAMASSNSDIYRKFGFWEVSEDVITLKWYATWDQDATGSRATARAYMGANRYPGEIQIDSAIIDNLERGITVLGVRSDNFMGGSFEIKVGGLGQAHFSGRIRRIRPPGPSATGVHAYEYEPNSGKIRSIRPPGPAETGSHAHAYKPIRCDRLVAAG